MKKIATIIAGFLLATTLTAPGIASAALSEQEANEIGVNAYLYFYPLVTMDVTRRQMTNIESGKIPGYGPANEFANVREYPTADMKVVVRPNFDTLYSIAWLDLVKEPIILSVPDTAERYYLMPLLDMWTDAFAVPGKRTTGTQAGDYAVVPHGSGRVSFRRVYSELMRLRRKYGPLAVRRPMVPRTMPLCIRCRTASNSLRFLSGEKSRSRRRLRSIPI
jgi:hypothetical protein